MNNPLIANIVRFISLLLFQVLVLKGISIGGKNLYYSHIMVYPLFIILLPIKTSRSAVLILAFFMGLSVDVFYNTLGFHASALVFMAFFRSRILTKMEPREKYNINFAPTKKRMGFGWFIQYAGIMLILHLFIYYSVDAFSFMHFGDLLLKTLFSFISSMIFILMLVVIFNT